MLTIAPVADFPLFDQTKKIANVDALGHHTADLFHGESNYELASETVKKTYLKLLYNDLVSEWLRQGAWMSSATEMTELDSFQRLLRLGRVIVPFVIDDLRTNPSNLVWLLNELYGIKVSDKSMSIEEASKRWVRLLENRLA